MFLNRNLITAEEHATTSSEASGIFDLQSQSVLKQAGRWPAVVVTVYEITYTITNGGGAFVLEDGGTVNYIVDWGDGSALETVTTNDKSHTYASSGNYTIKLDVQTASYAAAYWLKSSITQLTSITFISPTNMGTNGYARYSGATNLASFTVPSAAWSNLTRMEYFFNDCSSLTSVSDGDTSSCTTFDHAFRSNTSLVTAPSFNYSAATTMQGLFFGCTSLTTFPANQFNTTGTLASNAFAATFYNCALTAQSIENILASLDTNGSSNITLWMNGGTSAAYSTWSTAAQTALTNLTNKGWTVSYNT